MKRIFILVMVVVFAGTFVSGCTTKTESDGEIMSLMNENLRALENEDMEGYMATIHEQSAGYAITEHTMLEAFDMYDLKYELIDVKVVEKSSQEAKVKFVQITQKIDGPVFRDNKISGVHILKKSDGKWKIYDTQIDSIDYLN